MEWISVETRLPICNINVYDTIHKYRSLKSETVMIVLQSIVGNYRYTYIGHLVGDINSEKTETNYIMWVHGASDMIMVLDGYKVTHWMPLPEFPKI